MLFPDIPQGRNDLFDLIEPFEQSFVVGFGLGQTNDHDAFAVATFAHVLPDLFGDERHERMKRPQ